MDDLDRAVRAVVRECLVVKEGEEALIVCNPATQSIGERLRAEAADAGADAVLAVIAERPSHGAEPPRTVAEAMAAADVVMAPTVQSLSHTAARKGATDGGARCATLPGVTEQMLARVMSADMEGLRRKGEAVAEALDRASEARISDDNGTNLRLDLSGRKAILDAGDLGAGRSGDGVHGVAHRPWRRRDQHRRARHRYQREGGPHRGDPRGREDPGHLPRRLRGLGRDRRHGPGAGPPRLHRDEADRGAGRRADPPRRRATRPVNDATSAGEGRLPLVAVPNFSEGRSERVIETLEATLRGCARVLNRHFDTEHNRCVFTIAAEPAGLVDALIAGAREAINVIDLRGYRGLHPHIGELDVCPVVWQEEGRHEDAVAAARAAAEGIAGLGVPVFFYGELASTPERYERAFFRKGGPAELRRRMES